MADFNTHFSKLYPEIKDYVFFGWFIREELGKKKVIGINCSSSSLVRKFSSVKKVEEKIKSLKVPLVIEDENEFTKHFKILLRTVEKSYEVEPYTDDSNSFINSNKA